MATWSDKPIVKILEIPSRWIPGATMADALLAAESPDLSEADRMTRIYIKGIIATIAERDRVKRRRAEDFDPRDSDVAGISVAAIEP
ncbi:MAG: hypothetical protein IPL29_02660 [Propionivibrio sp.]|nr:hypothetical protein [Propionivibrio sp.]